MAPIDTVLQKGHYQKYHLAKLAPIINGTSQKWYLTTTLLTFWSTINALLTQESNRNITWKRKKLALKSHEHESESHNKYKNFLLKIIQVSPWHFFVEFCERLTWNGLIFRGKESCPKITWIWDLSLLGKFIVNVQRATMKYKTIRKLTVLDRVEVNLLKSGHCY